MWHFVPIDQTLQFAALSLVAILLATGCGFVNADRGTAAAAGDDEIVVLQRGEIPGPADPVAIFDAVLHGDVLDLTVRYSGGCEDHSFSLYGYVGWDKSIPPGGHFHLTHDANGDVCRAVKRETLRFDIRPIKKRWRDHFSYGGPVRLHLHAAGSEQHRLMTEI